MDDGGATSPIDILEIYPRSGFLAKKRLWNGKSSLMIFTRSRWDTISSNSRDEVTVLQLWTKIVLSSSRQSDLPICTRSIIRPYIFLRTLLDSIWVSLLTSESFVTIWRCVFKYSNRISDDPLRQVAVNQFDRWPSPLRDQMRALHTISKCFSRFGRYTLTHLKHSPFSIPPSPPFKWVHN